jgi:tRNA dimethylallyltransferase
MNKVVIIYGPTASGKTSLSLKLASILNAPIINMDSKQIYYHLNELTASPSPQEQKSIDHYLFNYQSANYESNVENWYREVENLLNSGIYKNYILVGGSGFYLKYFLTPGLHNQNSIIYQELINNYLHSFTWQDIVKILDFNNNPISRFMPHFNDKFRQFNYLKSYFQGKFSSENLLTVDIKEPMEKNLLASSIVMKKILIIVNPPLWQLQENIQIRTPTLLSSNTKEEALFIHHNLCYSNNFRSIIGFSELMDNSLKHQEVISKIELKTFSYAKKQRKWISQFMNYNPILLENPNSREILSHLNSRIFEDY